MDQGASTIPKWEVPVGSSKPEGPLMLEICRERYLQNRQSIQNVLSKSSTLALIVTFALGVYVESMKLDSITDREQFAYNVLEFSPTLLAGIALSILLIALMPRNYASPVRLKQYTERCKSGCFTDESFSWYLCTSYEEAYKHNAETMVVDLRRLRSASWLILASGLIFVLCKILEAFASGVKS